MQGMMTAIGCAPSQGRGGLDNGEVERARDALEARECRRGSGEAAADHANAWPRAIHSCSQGRLELTGSAGKKPPPLEWGRRSGSGGDYSSALPVDMSAHAEASDRRPIKA